MQFAKATVAALLLICSGWLVALTETPVPALAARVTDLAGVFTAEQKSALEARLAALESQKGVQIAVLTVLTTQPEAIEQYSIKVAEQWKLGRKSVDDGILLLLAKDDRKTRIEVGYGLEGVIPDAVAKRIIEEIMIPFFRNGDYYGGINAGVEKLVGLVQGESLPPPEAKSADVFLSGPYVFLVFVIALFSGSLMRAIFGPVLGGLLNGGICGALVWFLGGGLVLALIAGVIIMLFSLGNNGSSGPGGGYYGGGDLSGSRSSWGGFSSGDNGFSGGGGDFGGGGASGSW
ncbi:MAG: hypothetical protein CTY24_08935 [Methylobacter sp.]|nr:MAG: hypothetical protein CTY24_08935 [Methylobacter sp.]